MITHYVIVFIHVMLMFIIVNNLCPDAVHPRGPTEWGYVIIIMHCLVLMLSFFFALRSQARTVSYPEASYHDSQLGALGTLAAHSSARDSSPVPCSSSVGALVHATRATEHLSYLTSVPVGLDAHAVPHYHSVRKPRCSAVK